TQPPKFPGYYGGMGASVLFSKITVTESTSYTITIGVGGTAGSGVGGGDAGGLTKIALTSNSSNILLSLAGGGGGPYNNGETDTTADATLGLTVATARFFPADAGDGGAGGYATGSAASGTAGKNGFMAIQW
ncbi:MAG: hypothetical protein NTW48_09280, partial [Chloroflexi bacterium]|nr:hypothetical protein [Chloroflexota bacterium]